MKKLARRAVRFKGLTLGLDVHKGFIEYCVMDKKGDQIRGGFSEKRRAQRRATTRGITINIAH